jgi:hypothetical protein
VKDGFRPVIVPHDKSKEDTGGKHAGPGRADTGHDSADPFPREDGMVAICMKMPVPRQKELPAGQ